MTGSARAAWRTRCAGASAVACAALPFRALLVGGDAAIAACLALLTDLAARLVCVSGATDWRCCPSERRCRQSQCGKDGLHGILPWFQNSTRSARDEEAHAVCAILRKGSPFVLSAPWEAKGLIRSVSTCATATAFGSTALHAKSSQSFSPSRSSKHAGSAAGGTGWARWNSACGVAVVARGELGSAWRSRRDRGRTRGERDGQLSASGPVAVGPLSIPSMNLRSHAFGIECQRQCLARGLAMTGTAAKST